ncbi:hypothetical protein BDV95DRAFT_242079 [Massariosphaeria phaeospora]|uniref:DUF7770 domain-containing protein n=1 Tax=Massariosphaeria phaeospora TaxID=100035 RepID=A0A7C8I0M1_9PLEO|nr:hypothetical protein BDV95DRAFT_242079 [Massariosphaeria phaeospora]
MPPLRPADIDDANLNYYYIGQQTPYGTYYRLNQTRENFPDGFYEAERNASRGQAGTGAVATLGSSTAASQSNPSWKSTVVTHFRIVAHTMGPVMQGGQLSQNHWTIYMLTATGSVQLNMQADAVSNRGKLVVKEHAYITSNTAVQY